MQTIIEFIIAITQDLGVTNTFVLLIAIIVNMMALIYGVIVLEVHVSHSSITELIKYGRYNVTVKNTTTHKTETHTVKAMNKIAATEKVAKKIKKHQKLNDLTFKTERQSS